MMRPQIIGAAVAGAVVVAGIAVVSLRGDESSNETDGKPQTGEEQGQKSGPEGRTQALYVDGATDQVTALVDGVPHPVRPVDPEASVSSVDWAADHSRLVAAAGDTLFTWAGPDSTLVEATCDDCDVAYVDETDVVAGLVSDGTVVTYDPETLEPTGTTTIALPAPETGFVLYGDVGGKLLVAHSTSTEASSPDTLWLVDPTTGEASGSFKDDGGTGVSATAVDADGERLALFAHLPGTACGSVEQLYLLDVDDLTELSSVASPSSDEGIMSADTLFFNGDAVYATFVVAEADDSGEYCTQVASAGVWRLDEVAQAWEQVSEDQVEYVLPIEGLDGDPGTGSLSVVYDTDDGALVLSGVPASEEESLGEIGGVLWATPTHSEVDMSRVTSTPSSGDGEDPGDDEGDSGEPAPQTTEAAIARFEDYLHALGEEDIETACEIAGPGAQVAEDEGFGPCTEQYPIVFEMISPEQSAALRTATVDPDLVDDSTPGEVFVPLEAVIADATFTEDDLGSYTLRYQDGDWFLIA